MQSSPFSCHFLPLTSKYSPRHPVLRHPQSVFFPLVWETKFHTHTKLTYSMVQDIIRKADCYSAHQKISRFLTEPEASSPFSQKPATGPYPEPAESSSPHRSLSPQGPS
jgi:hypothetical protein